MVYCEGDEALKQVAQSCGCPILGSVKSLVGWSSKQPGLVSYPCPQQGVWNKMMFKVQPFNGWLQPKPFCVHMDTFRQQQKVFQMLLNGLFVCLFVFPSFLCLKRHLKLKFTIWRPGLAENPVKGPLNWNTLCAVKSTALTSILSLAPSREWQKM